MRKLPSHLVPLFLLAIASPALAQGPAVVPDVVPDVVPAVVPDIDGGDNLQLAQQQLYQLEENYDQMDPRLAEPLMALAEQLMAVGLYNEAHRQLDRGMQIVRVNQGLYTREQLPYLKKKIENFANAGDWESARAQMQHALWLYRTKSQFADQILVDDLLHLSNMHLRGVSEDSYNQQSYHFRRAVSANWMALSVGEALWGKLDKRLSPMLYSLVKQYHLQAVAIDRGGRTGYELRQVAPGSDWVRERSEMRRYYYFTGIRLLTQLQDIYARAEPLDAEGIAMADLYLADWQVLFGRHGEALNSYRQAYLGLQQARIDPDRIEHFFSRPSVLPEPRFYPSIEQALAARGGSGGPGGSALSLEAPAEHLVFAEWSPAFPYVNRPSGLTGSEGTRSNFALFSFNLAGVSDIPLWIDNRKATAFSRVQDARLVNTELESPDQEEMLLQRLQWLQFRPKLSNGLPQDSVATLRYQLASELPD